MSSSVATEKNAIPTEVLEAINHISGAYTSVLIDAISDFTENADSLICMQSIIRKLYENENFTETMQFLRMMYDICGLEYPQELVLIESSTPAIEVFINEFLLDFEDVILDYISK